MNVKMPSITQKSKISFLVQRAKLQPDFVYRTKSGCCAFLKRLMFTTFLKKDKMLYRVVQEYAHRRNIMEKQRAIEIVTEDLQAS